VTCSRTAARSSAFGHPGTVLPDFDAVLCGARAGEAAAFQALYDDLSRPVAAYLRGRGLTDVEDVTSEVFLAVFTGLARFKGDEADFRSWVFTIAHRRMVDEYRKRGRAPQLVPWEAETDVRTTGSAEEGALATLGEARVRAMLAELSDEQREVLLLRILGDLTIEQIADALGKRVGAVKALQRRGLIALRRSLESEGVPL
jgi:RNA polymerase sigma factor (sigma-70 family)